MDTGKILHKWYKAKKKMADLEQDLEKYKVYIMNEMNRQNVDKLSGQGYSITRRRNTRSYITKESLPSNLWKEYAIRANYDSFHLIRE